EMIRLQTQAAPTPPHILRPDLPEPAEAAILQALAKDPSQRFDSAASFAQAFTLGLQGQWAEGLTTGSVHIADTINASGEAASRPITVDMHAPPTPAAGLTGGSHRNSHNVRVALLVALAVAVIGGTVFASGTAMGFPMQRWGFLV